MTLTETIMPEFDQEMANTRKTLERVPDEKFDWKPHEKSFSLAGLATHVADIPSWTAKAFDQDELDVSPPGAPPYKLEDAKSRPQLLADFEENVASARAALEAASDEHWQGQWTLLAGGRKILTQPRTKIMRDFVMNHLIHHRPQLGVYLRLLDVPVPGIYGPSADEGGF
jgi:uncharacterized damage-inducible protein DinB